MNDVRLKILPPWTITIRKFEALFDGDPQIACNCNFNGANPSIVLACNNGDKVAALQQILPTEINFGNITMTVAVDGVPSNKAFTSKVELFDTALQFAADNLNDCHGIISTLYETIADELLTGPATEGVFYNTNVERANLGKPLGEWP